MDMFWRFTREWHRRSRTPQVPGGTFIVCIVPKSENDLAVIPYFQDAEVRGHSGDTGLWNRGGEYGGEGTNWGEEWLVIVSPPGPIMQMIQDMSGEELEEDRKEEDKEGSEGEGEIRVTEEREGLGEESGSEESGKRDGGMSQEKGKEGGEWDGEGTGIVSEEWEGGKEGTEGWQKVRQRCSRRKRGARKDGRSCSRSSSGGGLGGGLVLGAVLGRREGTEGGGELEACHWTGQPAVPFLQRKEGKGKG